MECSKDVNEIKHLRKQIENLRNENDQLKLIIIELEKRLERSSGEYQMWFPG